MSVSARFCGTVTNNGVPVEGTVTVATTTTAAGVSGPISTAGRFSVSVSVNPGDTITLTVDNGTRFVATTLMGMATAGYPVDLSCDIGGGSISNLKRFA